MVAVPLCPRLARLPSRTKAISWYCKRDDLFFSLFQRSTCFPATRAKEVSRKILNPKGAILPVERQHLLRASQSKKKVGVFDEMDCTEETMSFSRVLISESCHRRAAKDLKNGMYVNLGIGMPTLLGQHLTWNIPKDAGSMSSNGVTHRMLHFVCMFDSGETNSINHEMRVFHWFKTSGLSATTWSLVSRAQLKPGLKTVRSLSWRS